MSNFPRRVKFVYKGKGFQCKILNLIRGKTDSSIYINIPIKRRGEYRYGYKPIENKLGGNINIEMGNDIVTTQQPKISFHTGNNKYPYCRVHIKSLKDINKDTEVKCYRAHPASNYPEHIMTFHLYQGFENASLNEKDVIYLEPELLREKFLPLEIKIGYCNTLEKQPNNNHWVFRYKKNPNVFYFPTKDDIGNNKYYIMQINELREGLVNHHQNLNMLALFGWEAHGELIVDRKQILYLYHHTLSED